MLRITLVRESESPVMKLEGNLSGPWVDEVEHAWHEVSHDRPAKPVVVELSDVTFVSREGRKLLKSMLREGADLQSRSLMTQFLVGEIKRNGTTRNGG